MARRPISPLVHGGIDYGYVAAVLIVPRALGWSRRSRRLLAGAAATTFGYSFLTRYPTGALRLIPLPFHLALDVALGLAVFAAQFELTEEESGVRLACVALAVLSLGVAALSRSELERRGDD